MKVQTIAVVGLWHLGCVTAACLAKAGKNVIGIDNDQERILNLKQGQAPLYEQGLDDLIAEGTDSGRIYFTSELQEMEKADFVWITQDTPLDEDDNCDISELFAYFEDFRTRKGTHQYIVSSQVPVGTCEKLIQAIPDDKKPNIAYIPENLQLGKAITCFQSPNSIVIGSDNADYARLVANVVSSICDNTITCGIRTAEMVKHAINCFLATTISFSNELSELAVKMNANAYDVVKAMQQEPRIGSKLPLLPGPWFSGGTLARDVCTMQAIGHKTHTSTPLFNAIMSINNNHLNKLIDRLAEHVELQGAQVAVLGLVYTEGTDTLRRSPGLQVIAELQRRQAMIRVFEPMIKANQITDSSITVFDTALDAVADTDAVVVVRAGCVKYLEITQLVQKMSGRVVLDIWAAIPVSDNKNTNIIHILPGCKE